MCIRDRLRAEPIDDVLSGLESDLAPTENGWFTKLTDVVGLTDSEKERLELEEAAKAMLRREKAVSQFQYGIMRLQENGSLKTLVMTWRHAAAKVWLNDSVAREKSSILRLQEKLAALKTRAGAASMGKEGRQLQGEIERVEDL